MCQWANGENIIAQMQVCILFNVNMCVKHFAIFHTSRSLVEDKEMIASLEKNLAEQGVNSKNQNWKVKS